MDIINNSDFCFCSCNCSDGTRVQYVFVGCGHNQQGWDDPHCDCPLSERLRYEEVIVEDNQDFEFIWPFSELYLGG